MSAPALRQNAYITELDRFEETLQYWTQVYGAGPWFVSDVELAESTWRTTPAVVRCRVALTMLGPGQIEIIAPLGEESDSRVYRDWLRDRGPAPMAGLFHHFRLDVDSAAEFQELNRRLIDSGAEEGVRATAPGGRSVAYVDASATVGSFIELLTQTPQTLALIDRMREACAAWDGTDAIRDYVAFIAESTGSEIQGYAPAAS